MQRDAYTIHKKEMRNVYRTFDMTRNLLDIE